MGDKREEMKRRVLEALEDALAKGWDPQSLSGVTGVSPEEFRRLMRGEEPKNGLTWDMLAIHLRDE